MEVLLDFMVWCGQNNLLLKMNKTKELVVDFLRNTQTQTAVRHPGLGH